ncbi:MAG: hypothetical protein IPK19_27025 [Chloroflexi bacterium]|nr:hypothetical protein [Chloroflexota bacterium]
MNDLTLRVSVATLDRVVFRSPRDGTPMLALERKATLIEEGGEKHVRVRAQPFGGAIRLRHAEGLRDLIGDFQFDSARSQAEQDFRILIRPAEWPALKQVCLDHLRNEDDALLETDPRRELVEEFAENLHVDLRSDQVLLQPVGFVVENTPTGTDNLYSRGLPTVRIYRVFDVQIVNDSLCWAMLTANERWTDAALRGLAQEKGRANAVLTLPVEQVLDFYRGIPPERRYTPGRIEGQQLDSSVAALFEDVEVPQYERL